MTGSMFNVQCYKRLVQPVSHLYFGLTSRLLTYDGTIRQKERQRSNVELPAHMVTSMFRKPDSYCVLSRILYLPATYLHFM